MEFFRFFPSRTIENNSLIAHFWLKSHGCTNITNQKKISTLGKLKRRKITLNLIAAATVYTSGNQKFSDLDTNDNALDVRFYSPYLCYSRPHSFISCTQDHQPGLQHNNTSKRAKRNQRLSTLYTKISLLNRLSQKHKNEYPTRNTIIQTERTQSNSCSSMENYQLSHTPQAQCQQK